MAWTNEPNCKICKTINKQAEENSSALLKAIYNSTYFVKGANKTLSDIWKSYQQEFSYDGLLNHTKRHQSLTATQIHNKNQRQLAKQKAKQQEIKSTKAGTVWDEVIRVGMSKLKDGELEMKTSDLLKATKDKSDYELKVKDQEMQMAEMVAYFASGEGDLIESRKYDRRVVTNQAVEYYDPDEGITPEPTGSLDERTARSSSFYQSLSGDAAAPGAD